MIVQAWRAIKKVGKTTMATLAKSKENVLELGAVNIAQNCQKEHFANIVYCGHIAVRGRKILQSSSAEKALRTECHCKGQWSDWGRVGFEGLCCGLCLISNETKIVSNKERAQNLF